MRVLAVSLVIIAVLAAMVLPMAVSAGGITTPALYRCTVYEDGELAGAGLTVKAYVGTETAPRDGAEAVTSASGVAILEVPTSGADFEPSPKAISFTVNNVAASETPDVDISLQSQQVRLDVGDVGAFDWTFYDTSPPYDELSVDEALAAVYDYPGTITLVQLIDVLEYYFSQAPD